MTIEGNPSHSSNIPLEQAHKIGTTLLKLQKKMKKLTQEAVYSTNPLSTSLQCSPY